MIPKRTNEREIERAKEATQKQKKRKKERKKEIKREKGATILFLLKDPHSCFKVAFVLHRDLSYHSCITMWGPYTIELGLYIPMMSLLKRALGRREQASWMHAHQFHWRAFIDHMCIRCMAIPTPHIISIIWLSLAYDCPH